MSNTTRTRTLRAAVVTILLFSCVVVIAPAQIIVEGELTHIHEGAPADSYSGSILLNNISDDPQELKVYQTDYFFLSDGRAFYEEVGSVERTNGNWIEFFPKRFTIPARGSVQVNYTVDIPESASLTGTYWSMLMVEVIPEGSAESSSSSEEKKEEVAVGIQQVFRYGIQMVTHIKNTGAGTLEIFAAQLLRENDQKALQLDVTNVGDRWLRPTVWADLYDTEGNYAGKYEAGRLRIYPGTSVRFTIDLMEVPSGVYKALVVLDAGEGNVFGANYTLRLE
jgi:hypothetical protein